MRGGSVEIIYERVAGIDVGKKEVAVTEAFRVTARDVAW
jgi:hypothetical protein